MATELTIGKLADAAGVNVETIRYYQRRGLLDEPAKPLGGHRRYPVDMVKRLRFIKRAQALGFTLSEVGGLLTLDESCACAETRAVNQIADQHNTSEVLHHTTMRTAMHSVLRSPP